MTLTFKFGPLIRLWIKCFESKHSYFKRCMQSAQNYINVSGMLAERQQIFQAYQLNGNFFSSEIELKNCSAFHSDLHCLAIQKAVSGYNFSHENTVVTDSVCVRGSNFSKDCYVIVRDKNDEYYCKLHSACVVSE